MCPKTILSTHFHGVFSSGILSAEIPVDYSHMSIILSGSTSRPATELEPTFLYKLAPGLVTSSHALGCAALFGAPMHVRLRASRVSELLSQHEILELLDGQMDEDKVEEVNRMERVVRRFLETDFEDLDVGVITDKLDLKEEIDPNVVVMRHLKENILQLDNEELK